MCSLKKEQVSSHPASKSRAQERGGREKETERKESIREGKVQGKKVEKENGECTCNLTVMKGTPRKECNKTKVSTFGGRGLKKKEKKDLEFPARCLRTLRLPPGQSGPMK